MIDTPNRPAETAAMHEAAAEESAPQMDYGHHRRTYERFLHLVKWFILHALVLLPSLYFFVIERQLLTGAVLLLIAVGLLAYGIISTPAVARDVGRAFGQEPERR